MSAEKGYRAFMLRLWRVAGAQWRASLEDPHTGQRQAFSTLEKLVDYLLRAAPSGFAAEGEQPAGAAPKQPDQPNTAH